MHTTPKADDKTRLDAIKRGAPEPDDDLLGQDNDPDLENDQADSGPDSDRRELGERSSPGSGEEEGDADLQPNDVENGETAR